MKTLLLLRHAKSSWDNAQLTDHDRPLNERGKTDAPRIGKVIRDQKLVPDLILSSTAERALETAEAVAFACNYDRELVLSRELYHAPPQQYVQLLVGLGDELERVMVVGHNPGIEELVVWFTGSYVPMPTATLVQINLPIERWVLLQGQRQGRVEGVWRPKELKD